MDSLFLFGRFSSGTMVGFLTKAFHKLPGFNYNEAKFKNSE